MPLLTPLGYANAALVFTGTGGTPDFITTIGVKADGNENFLPTHANRVMSAFSTAANGKVCGKLILKKCVLHFGNPGNGFSVESTLPPFVFPTDGAVGTLSLSIVMQKRTDSGGRRGRGRMFLPGGIQNGECDPSGMLIPALYEKARLFGVNFRNALLQPTVNPNGVPGQNSVAPVLLHSGPELPSPIIQLIPSAHVGYIHGRT